MSVSQYRLGTKASLGWGGGCCGQLKLGGGIALDGGASARLQGVIPSVGGGWSGRFSGCARAASRAHVGCVCVQIGGWGRMSLLHRLLLCGIRDYIVIYMTLIGYIVVHMYMNFVL